MKNLFLKKSKSIGNKNLPGGRVGPYEQDTKLEKNIVSVIEKNIPYLLSVGVLLELEEDVVEAELVDETESEDETELEEDEAESEDEGEDASDLEWFEKLDKEEEKLYNFLIEKKVVNLMSELNAKGVKCKKNTPKDEIVRLIMGK